MTAADELATEVTEITENFTIESTEVNCRVSNNQRYPRITPSKRLACCANSALRSPLSALRQGITLMEVLISMFVLLFGLMGVAAIFPVGNHYVVQAEKFDRGNALATNAFEELRARGMLAPERWVYATPNVNSQTESGTGLVVQPPGSITPGAFNLTSPQGPGHAFVIDPMSTADAISIGQTADLDVWPKFDVVGVGTNTPNPFPLAGSRWPVRRVTLTSPNPGAIAQSIRMPLEVAETTFRLRDDLSTALPERDDYPGIVRWRYNGAQPLVREYQGDFSWLATVVPLTLDGLNALQPSVRETHPYEVSVVVFYKRVNTPQPETERMIDAEMLTGGELVMYGNTASLVDEKFKDIKSGDWVAVMGVNQTSGAFMLKWYRLLALDEEAVSESDPAENYDIQSQPGVFSFRRAMVQGPDWHYPNGNSVATNLRVAIFPGVASVVTREMELVEPVNDAPINLVP